jgi:hypothetical protein
MSDELIQEGIRLWAWWVIWTSRKGCSFIG